MSRTLAVAALCLILVNAPNANAEPGALNRVRTTWSSARAAVSGLAGRIGDRIAVARGSEAAMARVERLYEKGEKARSLRILDRMLHSGRLSGDPLARALLYTGTIQTELGRQAHAVSAFAGLAKVRPDFQLPESAPEPIQNNYANGRFVDYTGAVSGYLNAAQDPDRGLSLGSRLTYRARELKARAQDFIQRHPKLMAAYGKTVGRAMVWRAMNVLERQGVPRFGVVLEPDAQDPMGSAAAQHNGRVRMDYSATLSYPTTVATLAHEAYHLNNPSRLSPEGLRIAEQYYKTSSQGAELLARGQQMPRTQRAARRQIASKVWKVRADLRSLDRQLEKLMIAEEGQADRFSGRVLVNENLPVAKEGVDILHRAPDPYHPKPRQAYREFSAGVKEGLADLEHYYAPNAASRKGPPPAAK